MSTTTDLTTLKINYLTQEQYDTAKSQGNIQDNEIYLTPDQPISVAEDTSGTVYNVVLHTGTSSSFDPHKDTNGKYDDDAITTGLYYQSEVLYTPALVVGDINYTLTTEDYDSIDSMLESLDV